MKLKEDLRPPGTRLCLEAANSLYQAIEALNSHNSKAAAEHIDRAKALLEESIYPDKVPVTAD